MGSTCLWITLFVKAVCLSLSACGKADNTSVHWELKLYKDLMANYDKNIRPVRTPNQQLTATLQFALSRIESLDEKAQVMTTFGWMGVRWVDEILQWNPADYGGVGKMTVNSEQVWIPEIAMLNSVDQGSDLTLDANFRVTFHSTGQAKWVPGFKWKTSCRVNLRYFPFDGQICEVQFTNWMYGATEVNLTYAEGRVDESNYVKNGEWELTSAEVGRTDLVYNDGSEDFALPRVAFQLRLKRRPTFLVLNLVVPSLIMTIMAILVFCLPAEAGEKISLGITVMLSCSVVLLMVSDITPRASDTISILTEFIVISMGLTALALVSTIVVLNVHHHSPDKPVPVWLHTSILRVLALLLCMRRHRDMTSSDGTKCAKIVHPMTTDAVSDFKVKPIDSQLKGSVDSSDVLDILRTQEAERKEQRRNEVHQGDWKAVARVIDRLFLVIYSVVIIITSCISMGVMANNNEDGLMDGVSYIVS